MAQNKSYKIQIIVALFGLMGVIGAAVIAHWDKIFLPIDEPVIDRSGKIDQLFSQLDSISLDNVRQATKRLSLYANDKNYDKTVFLRLKSHLSLIQAPHHLKPKAFEDNRMYWKEAEKNAERREEAYIVPLKSLIDHFGEERRKTLYQTLLNNRSLIFGRLIAADKLCIMEGNGSYWKRLLEDSDPYFRKLTVNELGERQQDFIEDVLIFALDKPDLRHSAIYGLRDKQSKKAVPNLIDILKQDSNEWNRLAAYKALEKIDPEKAQQFPRPPKPKRTILPDFFK